MAAAAQCGPITGLTLLPPKYDSNTITEFSVRTNDNILMGYIRAMSTGSCLYIDVDNHILFRLDSKNHSIIGGIIDPSIQGPKKLRPLTYEEYLMAISKGHYGTDNVITTADGPARVDNSSLEPTLHSTPAGYPVTIPKQTQTQTQQTPMTPRIFNIPAQRTYSPPRQTEWVVQQADSPPQQTYSPPAPASDKVEELRRETIEKANARESDSTLPDKQYRIIFRWHPMRITNLTFVAKTPLGAYVLFLEKMAQDGTTDWDYSSWSKLYFYGFDIDFLVDSMVRRTVEATLYIIEQEILTYSTGQYVKAAGRD